MKVLLLLALLAVSALAAQKRYDGYPSETEKCGFVQRILYEGQNSIYDFWTEPRSLDEPIDIMVPPTHAKDFEIILQTYNLENRVKIQDVQSAIDVSRKDQASPTNVKDPRSRSGSSRYAVNWTQYYDYTAISVFLAQMAQAHPNIVTLKTIGKTHENREMYMVKISNPQTDSNVTKNAIIVDGGIHAREWISPAWTTWLINELAENYAAHPQYVDNLDWYILPAMNPDEGGAAGNGCDDTYHGPTAFSEDESANARDAILSIAERTQVYLSYHSYSQVWLTPWGYTADLPEDYPLLFDLAQNAVNNLTAVYGTQYAVGSTTGLLYVASGGSIDWIKGEAGIPYAYTVELRDTGDFGFLLPADYYTISHAQVRLFSNETPLSIGIGGNSPSGSEALRWVNAKNKVALEVLTKLYNERSDVYDFWTEPRNINRAVDIMVPPAFGSTFTSLMQAFDVDYKVRIADVQSTIEEGRKDIAKPVIRKEPRLSRDGTLRYSLNWETYSDLPAVGFTMHIQRQFEQILTLGFHLIEEFLTELAAAYPNLMTHSVVGQSYEGNNMNFVKISTGGTGKKAIFVDGGIHAREWISPAYVTWLIRELVENYAAHPQYVDNIDWYIMPVINPDGYRHTFAVNGKFKRFFTCQDRLWRKTRAPNAGSQCIGTDMNRNFGFHWDEGGSSDLPCGETYNGGAPFSAIESQIVRDAVLSVANQSVVYLTVHSYGQYWLTPWGYTPEYPADYPQLYDLAVRAVDKLTAVYGTQYTIGTSTNVLYIASGGSDDWAKGGAGIPYSYTVELRDTGKFGFELPATKC
ncbi:hypothetical protein DAPPUDRAFT_239963 [Daphnia pulex]|uniref:Peptidase M14 domain-containing protein n=1 Tax=Daphnia pulex TaxID=6669 RepID=E9GAI5_DAPPU|nr:hypothetical protein DAPPUDRAFT_239963 [Daphnia pulex]|eukprot:EFX83249.1 hypothetical protein DAPPUDRAFT_239963 [Daphnia pulex]